MYCVCACVCLFRFTFFLLYFVVDDVYRLLFYYKIRLLCYMPLCSSERRKKELVADIGYSIWVMGEKGYMGI